MALEQPMLGAELAGAKPALADDGLDLLLALLIGRVLLVVARRFLGHAAAERECEVDGALRPDVGGGQGRGGV